MIVVDIETSGVDPKKHSILSIGAVNLEKPSHQFYGECKIFEGAKINSDALKVNGFTEKEATDTTKPTPAELVEKFFFWVKQCNTKILAGHNPNFDFSFLRETALKAHLDWPFSFRTVDLHSVCYAHLKQHNREIPTYNGKHALNSDFVHRYVGLCKEPRPHQALTGAKMEAESFSRLFFKKKLLEEYDRFDLSENL
jgi:DNA polymerase III epsilon subunit-like protein